MFPVNATYKCSLLLVVVIKLLMLKVWGSTTGALPSTGLPGLSSGLLASAWPNPGFLSMWEWSSRWKSSLCFCCPLRAEQLETVLRSDVRGLINFCYLETVEYYGDLTNNDLPSILIASNNYSKVCGWLSPSIPIWVIPVLDCVCLLMCVFSALSINCFRAGNKHCPLCLHRWCTVGMEWRLCNEWVESVSSVVSCLDVCFCFRNADSKIKHNDKFTIYIFFFNVEPKHFRFLYYW